MAYHIDIIYYTMISLIRLQSIIYKHYLTLIKVFLNRLLILARLPFMCLEVFTNLAINTIKTEGKTRSLTGFFLLFFCVQKPNTVTPHADIKCEMLTKSKVIYRYTEK